MRLKPLIDLTPEQRAARYQRLRSMYDIVQAGLEALAPLHAVEFPRGETGDTEDHTMQSWAALSASADRLRRELFIVKRAYALEPGDIVTGGLEDREVTTVETTSWTTVVTYATGKPSTYASMEILHVIARPR